MNYFLSSLVLILRSLQMQTDVCALLCLPIRQSAPATCCFPGADLERAWGEGFKPSEKEITHSEASLAPEISSEKKKKPQRYVQNHSAVALVLVRSSHRQHRSGAVWPPALAVYYTADASLSFPSFQTCRSFSVAAYGEFVSGALWVEYMAVKHKFKFSLKTVACSSVASKICLYRLRKRGSSVPRQKAGGSLSLKSF